MLLICIPTRNRPDLLKHCLDSVVSTNHNLDYAIRVSDDSPDATIRQLNKEIVEKAGGTYAQGPQLGVCANRNNCLPEELERTDTLFIDDDCIIEEEGLRAVLSARLKYPDAILAGREKRPDSAPTPPYEFTFRGFYRSKEDGLIPPCKAALYPASALRQIGWNEDLYFGFEDADMALQAHRSGIQTILVPEFIVNDTGPDRVLNQDGSRQADLWVDAARIHLGLKRYLYYSIAPIRAAAFLLFITAYLFRRHTIKNIGTILRRVRWRKIVGAPLLTHHRGLGSIVRN